MSEVTKVLPGGPHVVRWVSVWPHLTTLLAAGGIQFIYESSHTGQSKLDQGLHLAGGPDFGNACFMFFYHAAKWQLWSLTSYSEIFKTEFFLLMALHDLKERPNSEAIPSFWKRRLEYTRTRIELALHCLNHWRWPVIFKFLPIYCCNAFLMQWNCTDNFNG